ncbi:hypothetical protein [Brevundimonas sp.]|uniref:hypothetical protein n=1 Tax=Brevundimonas sp. TaxID=1871086 RepID=UPI001D9A5B2F|nr:hypothetical protein [Brevundimonas sp.]MBL0948332.1 hypothetical protein [Brevundimonas sp.]
MRSDPSTSLTPSRLLLCATAALGLAAFAMPAVAQDAPALRYLDWNGRPEPVGMARATPGPRSGAPALRPAAPVIPHAGSQSMATVPQLRPATPLLPGRSVDANGRPGLTPADAFFAPPPAPSHPQPAPTAAVPVPAPVRTVAAPVETPPPPPPPARPMPEPQPARVPPVPQPAPQPQPAPARPAEWADDPMAPRSDALIWSVGQPQASQPQAQTRAPAPTPAPTPAPAPAPAPTPAPAQAQTRTEAAVGGARYYSVHRQNGRQPDRAVLPEPVYLDALPVQMDQIPTSPNMAEPPGPPQLVRNPDGTVRRTTGESASSAASRQ